MGWSIAKDDSVTSLVTTPNWLGCQGTLGHDGGFVKLISEKPRGGIQVPPNLLDLRSWHVTNGRLGPSIEEGSISVVRAVGLGALEGAVLILALFALG